MSKPLSFLLLQFLPLSLISQNNIESPDTSITKSYIENFKDLITLKLDIHDHIEIFEVNSDPNHFVISPNTALNTRLSFNYRFISLSLGFTPNFLPGNNDDTRKGQSEINSLGLNIQTKHWIQGIYFDKINGFYLQNSSDYIINWDQDSDNYIQFPELSFTSFMGQTGYKINPNLSLKSLSTQTERQLKSAGSFIPLLWYRYYIVDNKIELTGQNSSQKSNNFEGILKLGYVYNYAMKEKFYLSGGLAFGGGLVHTQLLTRFPAGEITTKDTNPIFRAQGQIAMGYNTRRFFSGIQAIARWDKYPQSNSSTFIENESISFQVFIGYRFNTPEFLVRTVDKVPIIQKNN